MVAAVLVAVPGAANAQTLTVFEDDFESGQGWQTNPSGTDQAVTGQWERANPQGTSFDGLTMQLDSTTSGSNALVTGATAGDSVGTNDIDDGVTTIISPEISLDGFTDLNLAFDYYMAHLGNSSSADFFSVSIVGDSTQEVLREEGEGVDDVAVWQRASIDISAFAGQTVQILIGAADTSGGSLVEAAVDTLEITGTPVVVNTPPEVTSPGDQASVEGDSVNLAVIGSDVDGDVLSWSASGLPGDLSINPSTGVISGDVAAGSASESPYAVSVSASDGTDTTTVNFAWTVEEAGENQSPVPVNPGDQTSVEGDEISLQLEATDADGDTVRFFTEQLPTGLSLDNDTGLISGTLADGSADNSPWSLFIAASDGISPAALFSFTWTVTAAGENQPPVPVNPGDQTSVEGDDVSLQIEATDPDGDDLLYFVEVLPSGLSLDNDTGLISGTVADDAAEGSPYAVVVAVVDGNNPAVPVSFTWTVSEPGGNLAPVVTSPGDQQSEEGDDVSLQVVGTDGDGDVLSWSAQDLPPGLSIDAATGEISGIVDAGAEDGSPYASSVSASDGTDTTTVNFTWTIGEVANQPPVPVNPGDQTSAEGDDVSLQLEVTDPDGDDLLYFVEVLPPGLSLGRTTGLISGTVADGAADGSPYLVVVAVIDGNNPAVPISFDWTVTETGENQPPFVLNPGPQASIDGEVVDGVQITGSDPEGQPLTWSATGLPEGLTIDEQTGVISGQIGPNESGDSPYLVVVTASDGSLSTNAVFEWIVSDGITPNTIITGTITDANGDPFIPAEVDQYTVAPDGTRGEFILSRANVPNGTYTIFTEPGCYFMTFIAPDGQTYNGGGFFTPPSFCIEEGDTQVVDAQLDPVEGGETIIGGTVTSVDGGVEGVQVDLFEANADGSRGAYLDSANTGSDGTYSFEVAPGCFVATFVAPEGETFINGQSFFNNFGCVESGETVSDLDAALAGVVIGDAGIGGEVRLGNGGPAVGVGIDLFAEAAGGGRGEYLVSTTTDADGAYNFGVDAGDYVLTFIAPAGETFNGSGFLSLPQSVAEGQFITDLDAQLDGAAEASIGGTVTDGAGGPVAGVGVDLFEANADGSRGAYLRSDVSGADGTYSFGADAACYVLTFIAPEGETFNGSGFLSLFQCVEPGENITDVDAQLDGDGGGVILVSINDGGTNEGAIGETNDVELTISLSAPSDATESVAVATADGTATASVDYIPLAQTVTFSPGETEKTVTVVVLGDDVLEGDEEFTVELSAPSAGLTIGDGSGSVQIVDDEQVALPELSIADASATEGDANAPVTLTVSLSDVSDADVEVDIATADGTAVAVDDYMANSATLTIPAGDTSVSFDVMIVGDDVEESTEEFSISLSNPVGATISDGDATVTIEDDDAPVSDDILVSVSDVTVTELNDGLRNAVVTFTISREFNRTVTIDFTTVDGTATVADNDYLPLSGTVAFAPGSTTRIRAVKTVGDRVVEPDETFTVELSNPTIVSPDDPTIEAVIDDGVGVITILNNDN